MISFYMGLEREVDTHGAFTVEFAGTPLFQRDEKIIDVFGDFLNFRGLKARWKGYQLRLPVNKTPDDLLTYARDTVSMLNRARGSGANSVLLNGSVFEELAFLELYRRNGALTPEQASSYTQMLLLETQKIDYIILILTSPETSLSTDPIARTHFNEGSFGLENLKKYPRRIMSPITLDLINSCFEDVLMRYAKLFNRFHIVDVRNEISLFRDHQLLSKISEGIWKGLARVYPIPPNPFYLIPRIPQEYQ